MVVLNPYHPWPEALGGLLLEYAAREVQLETLRVRDPKYRNFAHALIVRYVQLYFSRWILLQWNSPVPIPVPNLSEIFEKIDLDQLWEPTLPSRYLATSPAPTPAPPAAPRAARVPPAARPSPPATPAPAGPRGPNQIDNPDYNVGDFGAFGQIPLRIRDLLDSLPENPPPVSSYDAPPLRSNPTQPIRVCLSYHVKGHCNVNCGRNADHHPLTAPKRQELLAWCTQHYHAL
jgi:hypothetical protein